MYHLQQNKCYPQRCLLAHNNISQICYCGQISFQSAAVNGSFSVNLTSFGVTFILLAIVHALPANIHMRKKSSTPINTRCRRLEQSILPTRYCNENNSFLVSLLED